MIKWTAARVMTGREYEAKQKLKENNEGCDIFIPRRLITEYKNGKISQKTERVLPGYLIIGSEKPINAYLFNDCLKIIGQVTPEEIDSLKAQEFKEYGDIEEGAKIIINDGPFAGCKGVILTQDKENNIAKCKLAFQGMTVEPNMRLDYINTI